MRRLDTRLLALEARLQPTGESEEARFLRLADAIFTALQDHEWHNAKTLHETALEPAGFAWHEFAPLVSEWADEALLDRRIYHCNEARGADYRLPDCGEGQGVSFCQRWSCDVTNGKLFYTRLLFDRGITQYTEADRQAIAESARMIQVRRRIPIWGPGPYADLGGHEEAILAAAAAQGEAHAP